MIETSRLRIHLDRAAFVEAARFTAASTGFDPRLVEKGYFCTLVLEQLSGIDALVFNYCSILRDDGFSYGDYVEQLTFLLARGSAAQR